MVFGRLNKELMIERLLYCAAVFICWVKRHENDWSPPKLKFTILSLNEEVDEVSDFTKCYCCSKVIILVCNLCDQASSWCWLPLLLQWLPNQGTQAMATPPQATLLPLLLLPPLLLATPLSLQLIASTCRGLTLPLPPISALSPAHTCTHSNRTELCCSGSRLLKHGWAFVPDETPPVTETAIESLHLCLVHSHSSGFSSRPVDTPLLPFPLGYSNCIIDLTAWSHLSTFRDTEPPCYVAVQCRLCKTEQNST